MEGLNFAIFLATIAVSKHHLPASFFGGNCSGKMLWKKIAVAQK